MNPITPDRSQAYALQHATNMNTLHSFMSGSQKTVDMQINFAKFTSGLIEWDNSITTMTRSQVTTALKACIKNAREHGPKSCEALPPKANKTGLLNAMTMTTTSKKHGQLNLILVGLAKARKVIRTQEQTAVLNAAVEANTAWYAPGVVNKDGTPRAWPTEMKARKAGCRLMFGAEWYMNDKSNRLSSIAVTQNYDEVYVPHISELNNTQIIALAKKNGAPTKVTTGKGAKVRATEWLENNNLLLVD